MWKRIKDSQYFLSFTKNHAYEIYVTDYISIWTTIFTEKAFLAQLKHSNDGLELQHDNEFVQKGLHLLSNPDQLKKLSIEKEENGKSLFITMAISFGYPFYLECKLTKGSEELYFQKITQPFLKIISDLRASETELRRLLIKKDNEIEEYKCEGGEIVLRHLKTVAFNDKAHMMKHKVYGESFGPSDVLTSLVEKIVEVPEQKIIKQEPNVTQIKVENPDPAVNIKTETNATVKNEPVTTVKIEPNTDVDEQNTPVITASVSCKQEVKKETMRAHIPRKRSKFNF